VTVTVIFTFTFRRLRNASTSLDSVEEKARLERVVEERERGIGRVEG
jgi:hypothetical protein